MLIHLVPSRVRASLRTCSRLCADAQRLLQCLSCGTRLLERVGRSCRVFPRCDSSHPMSLCMGLSARAGELAAPLSVPCVFSRHLVIFDVESALETRVWGDEVVLPDGLRWVQVLSCRVLSRFLRRLGGEAAGRVDHAGRCRWVTLFGVTPHVSQLAISRLPGCVALWRTMGRPEDSLSSNVTFGRKRRVPHLARLSRQLTRHFLRSLASPGCLS